MTDKNYRQNDRKNDRLKRSTKITGKNDQQYDRRKGPTAFIRNYDFSGPYALAAAMGRRIGHPYQNRTPPKRKKPRTSFSRLQVKNALAYFSMSLT
jgi:hypothetical protein